MVTCARAAVKSRRRSCVNDELRGVSVGARLSSVATPRVQSAVGDATSAECSGRRVSLRSRCPWWTRTAASSARRLRHNALARDGRRLCASGGRRSPWAGTCALAVPARAAFRSRAKLARAARRSVAGAAVRAATNFRVVSKPVARASWSRRTSRAMTSNRRAWRRNTGRRLSSHEPNAGTTPSSSSTI